MDDLISKQAAIDALNDEYHGMISDESMKIYQIIDWLNDLPSAQPEPKTGEWITDSEYIDCSVCRREKWSRVPYENLVKGFKYCPNCGTKMEG